MLGPVATRLERRGLRSALSASLVVILSSLAICLFALALATPLSFWIARLPQLWADLQLQLSELKGPLEALKSMRDQLRELDRRRRPHRLGRRGHGRRKHGDPCSGRRRRRF